MQPKTIKLSHEPSSKLADKSYSKYDSLVQPSIIKLLHDPSSVFAAESYSK